MQVTSNYYRCRLQRYGFSPLLLTVPNVVSPAAASSAYSSEVHGKPLKPSRRTLRDLAALHKSENQFD